LRGSACEWDWRERCLAGGVLGEWGGEYSCEWGCELDCEWDCEWDFACVLGGTATATAAAIDLPIDASADGGLDDGVDGGDDGDVDGVDGGFDDGVLGEWGTETSRKSASSLAVDGAVSITVGACSRVGHSSHSSSAATVFATPLAAYK